MTGENEKLYSKLNNYQSDADFESIWSKIDEKRKPKKKRFFLWISFFSLLILSSYVYLTLDKTEESPASTKNIFVKNILTKPAPTNSDFSNESAQGSVHNESENQGSSTKQFASSKTELNSISRKTTVHQANGSPSNNQLKKNISQASDPLNNLKVNNHQIFSSSPVNVTHKLTKTIEKSDLSNTVSPTLKLAPIDKNDRDSKLNHIASLERLSSVTSYARLINLPKLSAYNYPIPNVKKKNNWSFLLSGSYGLHDNRLESKNEDTWFQNRSTIEESIDVLSMSLFMEYAINERLSIRTGLAYYRAYSKSTQSLLTENDIVVKDQVTKVIVSLDGSEILERGDLIAIEIESTNYSRYTNLNDLEIPVLLNLKAIKAKSLGISLLLGPAISVYSSFNGQIINKDGSDFVDLESLNINTSRNFSFYAGVECTTSISKTFDVGIGLFSRTALGSIYKNSFNAKPVDLSAQASLFRRF